MTVEQVAGLGPAFTDYLRCFRSCFVTKNTFAHLGTYCRGLLSDLARKSLFQPTISFKKRGMGLGLSIARKSALLLGGDILPVKGELGGAAFRVLLPVYEANSDRG